MNQPSQGPNTNDTFSSSPAPTTNPFPGEMKGEFPSNFGTNLNTNAVSQIYKDGYGSSANTKWIIVGVAALALIVVAFFIFTSVDDTSSIPEDTQAENTAPAAVPEVPATPTDATATTPTDATATSAVPANQVAASGSVKIVSPDDGRARDYDETMGPAVFQWEGTATHIVFSRNAKMSPETMRVPVSGTSYKFHNPWPGEWYWKLEGADGASSEVRKFTVNPPPRVNLVLNAPAAGSSLAGTGGEVAWTVDTRRIAFFRVELSSSNSWANPQYRFATSGEKLALQGVAPGQYQLRVGAFSEVSGRWEYTNPVSVSVQ